MDRMDLFAYPLPTFNLQGATKVSSCVGLSFSVALYLLVFTFALGRLMIILGDGNPTFSTYEIDSEYELNHRVELDKFGF